MTGLPGLPAGRGGDAKPGGWWRLLQAACRQRSEQVVRARPGGSGPSQTTQRSVTLPLRDAGTTGHVTRLAPFAGRPSHPSTCFRPVQSEGLNDLTHSRTPAPGGGAGGLPQGGANPTMKPTQPGRRPAVAGRNRQRNKRRTADVVTHHQLAADRQPAAIPPPPSPPWLAFQPDIAIRAKSAVIPPAARHERSSCPTGRCATQHGLRPQAPRHRSFSGSPTRQTDHPP